MSTKILRDNSVTIAKAIAIILMVMGHAKMPSTINAALALLRMPLFFIMCGYCFKEKYLATPKDYYKKRLTGIYWPYIKWSLFFLALHNIFCYFHIQDQAYNTTSRINCNPYTPYDFATSALCIIARMERHAQLLSTFWFLKSLLFGSIIFYLFKKYLKNVVISAFILIVLCILFRYFHLRTPILHLDHEQLFAAFFIMFGHWYKEGKFEWERKYYFWFLTIILLILGLNFWRTGMRWIEPWQIIPYSITAICGTLWIFGISHKLEKYKNKVIDFLIYTGGHTFNVMTWHLLSFKLINLIIIITYSLPIAALASYPAIEEYARKGWWIAYSIVGVGVPIGGTYIRERIINRFKKGK